MLLKSCGVELGPLYAGYAEGFGSNPFIVFDESIFFISFRLIGFEGPFFCNTRSLAVLLIGICFSAA